MSSRPGCIWIYEQKTGRLSLDGELAGAGYSGAPDGLNDPAKQSIADVGPIPQGTYLIGPPVDSPEHGPYALGLLPDAANQMFGRSGFLLHGDSIEHPGCASKGCIIMTRKARQTVWESSVHLLEVV